MKIAYILLTHKNPIQVGRLIKSLNTDSTIFYIHVDNNIPLENFKREVLSTNITSDHIHFLEKRYRTRWGGFNNVKATVELIGFALKYKPDNIILLSGQDYPLKSNTSIKEYLQKYKDQVLIEFKLYNFADPNSSRINRYYFWDYFDFKKQSVIPRLLTKIFMKRKFLRDMDPFIGRQWFILPQDIAEFVYSEYYFNKKLTNYFKYVFCADELYFQTLLMNSKYIRRVKNIATHFADYNHANPIVWKSIDIDLLKQKSNLFARKFDIEIDEEILNLLDKHIQMN